MVLTIGLDAKEQEGVPDFRDVLETALELEAPLIRVWAGNIGSERADQRVWDRAVEDSIRIGDMAKRRGYHRSL